MIRDDLCLFGASTSLLEPLNHNNKYLHKDVIEDWNNFKELALKEGIELQIISSFRDYSTQQRIWNHKASGQRVLLNDKEEEIPFSHFNLNNKDSRIELMHTILRWSALPGLSRHHWGCDFDIIDKAALEQRPGHQVQLIPSEYASQGIFEGLGQFLDEHLSSSPFFRPYNEDLGGVAPEPWHLSHRSVSQEFMDSIDTEKYECFLREHHKDLHLYAEIIESLEEIFNRYVYNVSL